jgi:hypothetical protein
LPLKLCPSTAVRVGVLNVCVGAVTVTVVLMVVVAPPVSVTLIWTV